MKLKASRRRSTHNLFIKSSETNLSFQCWCRTLSCCVLWYWNELIINKMQNIFNAFIDVNGVKFAYGVGIEELIYIPFFKDIFMWPSVNGNVLTYQIDIRSDHTNIISSCSESHFIISFFPFNLRKLLSYHMYLQVPHSNPSK